MIAFDNTYARLPARFYTRQAPVPVAQPERIVVNEALARELGIDPAEISAVWLLGSAGAYPGSGLELGEVVIGASHHLALDLARGHALAPLPRHAAPHLPPAAAADSTLRRVATVTTGAVTTAPADAARLAALGQVEHLEAFSVARWAERARIPFAALLAISNHVGPDAHSQWQNWRTRAEHAAGATFRRIIAG